MAVTQNPLTGRSRGKVANFVMSKWRSLNVVKSKPLTVANPRSPGQMRSRVELGALSGLAKFGGAALKAGFSHATIGKTERNRFVQLNYDEVSSIGGATPTIAYSALKYSEGSLAKLVNGTPVTTANSVTVPFTAQTVQSGNSNNAVCYVLISAVGDNGINAITTTLAGGTSLAITNIPFSPIGGRLYIFQANVTNKTKSDSKFIQL